MGVIADGLLRRLVEAGWSVKQRRTGVLKLDTGVSSRYPSLPREYVEFLGGFDLCVNRGETAWFLSESDFNGTSGSAFKWNEFELQEAEAAQGDGRWQSEVRAFWDRHLPILISVTDGYSYLAIETESGHVVHGREPEYEDVVMVSSSFDEFAALVGRVLTGAEHQLLSRIL
jgi:hypothetical protein